MSLVFVTKFHVFTVHPHVWDTEAALVNSENLPIILNAVIYLANSVRYDALIVN